MFRSSHSLLQQAQRVICTLIQNSGTTSLTSEHKQVVHLPVEQSVFGENNIITAMGVVPAARNATKLVEVGVSWSFTLSRFPFRL